MPAHFFQIVNLMALASWIILIGFPSWRGAPKGIINGAILLLCFFYLVLITDWVMHGAVGGFGSLADVMLLFRSEKAVLAGWIHYLAFDLFIGTWITQDAQRIGLPRWLLVIIQFFTFMFGPIGLGLYILIRRRKTGEIISQL
jgi:hypothetical protein